MAPFHLFQLASYRKDYEKIYEIGKEMVCFNNIIDLKEKINYDLNNNQERNAISTRAYH
ncbi:MAG: glycosyltransferase family protein [Bacillota bacterium]